MGLCRQRVAEENDAVQLIFGHQRPDLLIPSHRARQKPVQFQPRGLPDPPSRCSRCIQNVLFQNLPVGDCKLNHLFLLAVVSNQSDLHGVPSRAIFVKKPTR